ncbi:hypothetical protein [Williamsia sp.]|uniref:hypothetical protein n=1 Tax=Williamsia sp. TaxID=1872085 RepID=UPI002F94F301
MSLNGRSNEKGDKALADFGVGDRAAFFPGDVTVQNDVEDFIEQTVATFGRIDDQQDDEVDRPRGGHRRHHRSADQRRRRHRLVLIPRSPASTRRQRKRWSTG